MQKMCQNGIEMDAKTHKKSMQKLVTGNIRKIMKTTWFSDVLNHAKIHDFSTFSRKGVFEKSTIIAGLFAQNYDWAPSKNIKNQPTHIEKHIKQQ